MNTLFYSEVSYRGELIGSGGVWGNGGGVGFYHTTLTSYPADGMGIGYNYGYAWESGNGSSVSNSFTISIEGDQRY